MFCSSINSLMPSLVKVWWLPLMRSSIKLVNREAGVRYPDPVYSTQVPFTGFALSTQSAVYYRRGPMNMKVGGRTLGFRPSVRSASTFAQNSTSASLESKSLGCRTMFASTFSRR